MKAAIKAFAQALRVDVANRGVRVSVVHPGMVDTPFFSELPFRPGQVSGQHLTPIKLRERSVEFWTRPLGWSWMKSRYLRKSTWSSLKRAEAPLRHQVSTWL